MDSLMYIHADGSAFNELPSSIGNLPRLHCLTLRSCKSLRKLPNSLLTLDNLVALLLGGLKLHGRKSLTKLFQENQPPIMSCSKLDRLDLHDCGLLDEDLHQTLKCFKHVRDLNLSWNDFPSLPECIKECVHMVKLEVNDCKRLRDIPELPSSLGNIMADNCTSLTMESSGRLWSQAIKSYRVAVWMPATTYPEWFDHCCQGGTLSFRVHGRNFPRVVIAFEIGKTNRNKRYRFHVFMSINGSTKMPWTQSDFPIEAEGGCVLGYSVEQGHMFFSDLLGEFTEEEIEGLNKSLELDWNDVEIQVTCDSNDTDIERFNKSQELDWNDVEIQDTCDSDDIDIVNCGVYVDKKLANMKNVQFKSSRTSLKRRAIVSLPSEPPKMLLRKFKTTCKRNVNNTKKRTRRTKPRHFHSWYRRRKMFFFQWVRIF
ncbi:disease resistance protein RML1B-like [Prosopis cineraria]|uniref:disease resistance protein RML1B-like n=1 Tax=Prosopis cineraria TaxID=364024 RepID=UPI00240EFCB0|nr:disease resistance protein RML1B-like [Prosopis cineraria]